MKVSRISLFAFFFFFLAIEFSPLYGQHLVVDEYLKQTGNYAAFYRGEIEYFYNPYIYKTNPYYVSDEFVMGELYYDGKYYPNQRMRMDTFKEQILILNPQNQSVILDSRKFQKAQIHGKEIINHYPPQGSGMKPGYYISLYQGESLSLLGKEKHALRILPTQIEYTFDRSVNYYILHAGKYYTVKNKKSFTRLFPELKKQINQYSKKEGLDFRERRENSLTVLGKYCDQLINSQNHPE